MGPYKNISSTAIIIQIRITEMKKKEKRIVFLLWISMFWVMLTVESWKTSNLFFPVHHLELSILICLITKIIEIWFLFSW